MTTPPATVGSNTARAVRFGKAQVVSGIATAVDWLVVTTLIHTGLYYVTAVIAGALAGAVTDFLFKKIWVFGTRARRGPGEAVRYSIVSGVSALLNGGCVYLLVDGLGLAKPPAVVLASVIIGLAWNYPLQALFVFSHAAPPEES